MDLPSPITKINIEEVITKLTLSDKFKLLGGKDFWRLEDNPEHGIPSVRCPDGPNGVRGRKFFNSTPASCFPCGTGLAASWDTQLLHRVGQGIGQEAKAKSAHIVLGPTINVLRSPLGGRGFESYSEDPVLSGHLAGAYVNGLQEEGVAACIKHFVGR